MGMHGHVVDEWALDAQSPEVYMYTIGEVQEHAMTYLVTHHREAWLSALRFGVAAVAGQRPELGLYKCPYQMAP